MHAIAEQMHGETDARNPTRNIATHSAAISAFRGAYERESGSDRLVLYHHV